MKTRKFEFLIAVSLFAALAMPIGMAAQDTPSPDNKPKHHKYKLIALGTFGGPHGAFNPEGNGGPYINGRGAAVAYAQTTVPLPANNNGFLCFPEPNVGHGLRWQNGHSTDLGALSPADQNCSGALAINNSGVVAGLSENGILDPLIGLTELRAVVWRNGTISDLGTFGGNESGAFSINEQGQLVGFALNDVPDPYSIYDAIFMGSPNGTQTRAFLWEQGHMRDLGTLGGPDADAGVSGFINDSGRIAGISYTTSTPNLTTGFPTLHPFLWERGRMADLGSLGGTLGFAFALNRRGQVVGLSTLPGDNVAHGYFWDGLTMRDVGTLGGSTSEADSLNDAGEVVGVADFAGDQVHDAFLWRRGVMHDLGNLGRTSHAWSINLAGQVVGDSRIDDTTVHSFLWEDGEMVDLNDLVSPKSDVVLLNVTVIADNGEIGLSGLSPGCASEETCGHPYLLIPDGDCDNDNEARIAATQTRIAAERATAVQHPATAKQASDSTLSPIERVRSMMRQRYHLPGQTAAPRD